MKGNRNVLAGVGHQRAFVQLVIIVITFIIIQFFFVVIFFFLVVRLLFFVLDFQGRVGNLPELNVRKFLQISRPFPAGAKHHFTQSAS